MAENKFFQSPIDKVVEEAKGYRLPSLDKLPSLDSAAPRSDAQSLRSNGLLPPSSIQPIFEEASATYGVPLNVLAALAQQESSYNDLAVGPNTKWGRAKGIMQYLDSTAKGLGINPFDPRESIPAAARQLRERLDKGYTLEEAIMAHHGGDNRKQWGEKTRAYARQVLGKAGKIGEDLMASRPAQEVDLDALQAELDAQEPGRYRVLSPAQAAAMQGRERLINDPLGAAIDGFTKKPAPSPLTIENQQAATRTPQAPSPLSPENQRRVQMGLQPKDTRPYQGFLEATGNALSNVPERFQQSIAGLIQMAGEDMGRDRERYIADRARQYGITPGDMKLLAWAGNQKLIDPKAPIPQSLEYVKKNIAPSLNEQQLKELSAAGIINPDEIAAYAKQWREDTKKTMAEVRPEPGSMAYYGSAAIGSIAEMAPMIAGAILTRSPAVATGIMSGQVGGQSYAEAREKGLSEEQAQTYAVLTAAAEAAPEALVVGRLLKPGAGVAKKILEGTVLEGAQEAVTAALQAGIDQQMIEPDMTLKEALVRIRDGAIVGAMVGGGMGGAFATADAIANRGKRQQAGPSAPQAEPRSATPAAATSDTTPQSEAPATPAAPVPEQVAPAPVNDNAAPEAPQPPRGPLSRAAERAVQSEGAERVRVQTPIGEIAGTMESFEQDTKGGWQARILGDDGQFYQYTDKDGVQIAPEAAVVGEAAAPQDMPEPEAVEQQQEEPAAIEAAEAMRLADTNMDLSKRGIQDVAGEPTETSAETVRDDGREGAGPQGRRAAGEAPAGAGQAAGPASQGLNVPVNAPKREELRYEDMTEAELRERLKYLAQQAKTNGGWDKLLLAERKKVENAINARVAEREAQQQAASQAPVKEETPATPEPQAEQPAADQKPVKWFGTREKADAFIAKKGLTASHEVVQTGKVRFEVKPKAPQVADSRNDIADETPVVVINKRTGQEVDIGIYRGTDARTGSARVEVSPGKISFRHPDAYEIRPMSGDGRSQAPAEKSEPTVKAKRGRAGAAALKKLAEAAGLPLDDTANRDTADMIAFFDRFYEAGRDGRDMPRADIHPQDARAAYEAGRKDREAASQAPKAPQATPSKRQTAKQGAKPEQPKQEKAKPEQPKAKTSPRVIGKNADGEVVFEDERGVRSVADGGVRISEPVAMRPTRTGMEISVEKRTDRFRTAEEIAERDKDEAPKAAAPRPEKPAVSENKIFTEDAAEKARALLRSKLTQLNSGIDPEIMQAGITLAGYHIEKGARTFAAYAKAMTADLGDMVKPYLKSWYMGVKYDPRAAGFDGMSSAAEVEAFNIDEVTNDTQATEAGAGAEPAGAEPGRVQADEGDRPAGAVPGEPDGRVRAERGRRTAKRAERAGDEGQPGQGAGAEQPVRGDRARGAEPGGRADRSNYRIQPGELKRTGSWKATAEQNVRIVELVKQITAEGRQATPEEKALLTKFTGWGASEIANGIFPDQYGRYKDGWRELGERLEKALTPEEYAQAKRTTQYAHYTSEPIIRSIYNALGRMGFNGGQVLEPGMGIGLFNGLMPDSMVPHSTYTGVEYDSITGNIAKLLYPESNIVVGDFTQTKLPRDFFDAAIGNPPFGQIKIQADPEYRKHNFLLHDYFFAKTIDRVKPGGLLVFVTSKGTMDKANDRARKYLAERADLVGAIRLPQTAFKDNAGTEVVTDVIFLRKRAEGQEPAGEAWAGLAEVQTPQGPAMVNEYFAAHPEMVLGRHAKTGSMYRADEYTVEPIEGDIEELFAKAVQNLPENIYRPERGSQAEAAAVQQRDYDPKVKKEGGVYVADDGTLMQVESGQGVPLKTRLGSNGKELELKPREVEWLKGYTAVRDALKQAQYDQLNDGPWEKSLKALNKAYDAFVKKHGPILAHSVTERENDDGSVTVTRRFKNEPLLRLDAEGALAYALEVINEDGTISKGAVLKGRILNKPATPEIATVQDALFVSLNNRGRLDIDEIASLSGQDRDAVIAELGTLIYEDPASGWTMADEYLSGNVVRKLKEAEAAARLDKRFARNVEALKNVQPRALAPADITVMLGSAWVPASDVANFAAEQLGESMQVSYSPVTGQWNVEGGYGRSVSEWGYKNWTPADILEGVLNNKTLKVTYRDQDGKTHTDAEGTEKVNDIAKKMRDAFKRWIWSDAKRADRLARHYNENYNNIVPPSYDGSHLTLPGVSSRFKLYPHQKRAIWRIVQQGDNYLAHSVGAGKAQPLDAKILTPRGWVRMGDIRVGDQVITKSGRPTTVEAVFPQGEKEIFRVTFSDGSSTECCAEHLWLTQTYAERNAANNARRLGKSWPSALPKVRQLSEIMETLKAPHLGAKNHSIPLVEAVEFEPRDVPLDPYLVGALLGDGHIGEKAVSLSGLDKEVIYSIALPDGVILRENTDGKRCPSWHLVGTEWRANPVLAACRSLGLSGKKSHEKFVPEVYLFNTPAVRLAVLRGLMDTDGTISKSGRAVSFSTASAQLADDVTFLVRSLGGTVRRTTKKPTYTHNGEQREGRVSHILSICLPAEVNPFHIARKASKVVGKSRYAPARYIVSVEPVGLKPAQCIRVADPSHLYVTDDFIVTHNTFTMIAAAMEERRLGLVKKPLFAVPNHMLAQFSKEFLELYPTAQIMVADETNFHTHNRRRFVAQAALNDPDAIIITHSAFGRIGMSPEFTQRFIQDQIDEWQDALEEADKGDRVTRKQIERRIEQLENRLKAAISGAKDNVLSFEELGVDRLYVDEMHEFRKLDFATNRGNVKGIDPSGSQRAMDLMMKVQYLRTKNPSRAIVGASGTPITNTMGELFTVQRIFQPNQLEEDGLSSFDAWSNQFGEVVDALEQNAAGGYESVSRFAKFVNVPELMSRVRSFMDILTSEQLGQLVQRPSVEQGGRQVVVTPSPDGYKAYQKTLEERIKAIRDRRGPPKPGDDIILNVIADGRFSAIDMRFVDPSLPSDPNSKLNRVLDDMIEAYHRTAENEYETRGEVDPIKGSTLMLFTDIGLGEQSAKSRGFDMKAWIEKRLIEGGVKPEHIAFMRDHKAHAKKERLFEDLRQGRKRILIGGKDMETGVNAQKRLIELFHLDAPWFPASVEQREGRIIRQGNQNKQVRIRAYATKGSYDSTMWGMNARKARFIEQAMTGDSSVRAMEDVSEASAFEMAAALASGDERYLKLAGLKGDVERLGRLYAAHMDDQRRLRSEKMGAEASLKHSAEVIAQLKEAIAQRQPIKAGEFTGKVGGKTYDTREDFSNALFAKFKELAEGYTAGEQTIGEIGGFPVVYTGVEMRGGNFAADASLQIPGDPDPLIVFPIDPNASVTGIATRAANQVNGLDRELTKREESSQNMRRRLEQIESRLGAPFAELADLTEKQEALAALEAELEAESKAASAEAAAATAEVEGQTEATEDNAPRYSVQDGQVQAEFGPVIEAADAADAISKLKDAQTGEAIVVKPGIGEISLVYGNRSMGLAHIEARRGEAMLDRLPDLIENGTVYTREGQNDRLFIGNDRDEAVIRLDWNSRAKTWLLTAYEKHPNLEVAGSVPRQGARSQVVAERAQRQAMTTDQVRQAITKGVNGKLIIDTMVAKGLIQIHPNTSTLPKELGRGKRGIQAVTAPDNRIHLVASNLTPQNANAVLLHEMFHSGVENLVGSKRWAELMGRLGSLYRQAERSSGKAREIFDRARTRVAYAKAQGAVATRMEVEEFGAYTIEEYESLPAGFRKWVDDLVGAIKAWLFSRYGMQLGNVTPAQLRALAKDALINVAMKRRGELFGKAAERFSSVKVTESPANPDIRFSVLPDDTALEDATKALDEPAQYKPDFIGQLQQDIGRLAKILLHPRQIAALHKDFAPVYRAAIEQFEMRDSIIDEFQQDHKAYDVLPQKSKKRVNAVLELGRLLSTTYSEAKLREGVVNPGVKNVVKFTEGGSTYREKEKINALLSAEGEVIQLSEAEIQAYLGLRKMFDKALDKFKDQTLEDFGFPELVGQQKAAGEILAMIDATTPAEKAERLQNIARFIQEIEQAKRTGYVPFARYGDYVVAVKEQQFDLKLIHDPYSGGWIARDLPLPYQKLMDEIGAQWDELEGGYRLNRTQRQALMKENERTIHSAKVEFTARDRLMMKAGRPVEQLPSVKAALAEAEKWKAGNPNRRIVAFEVIQKKPEGGMKLSDVDALAEVAMLDNETWDAVRDQLADAIKGRSFRKHFFQADNVPGYTADFERAIADYMAGMAGYLSRRHYNSTWDNAIAAIKAPRLFDYANKYRAYANEPQEELAMLRQVGFFHYIAGVPATAFVNLTQPILMTIPALGQIASMPMVMREMTRAYKDALAMIRVNKRVGLDFFDPSKAPADIRPELVKSWGEGMFVPLQTYEVMATARQRNVGHRQAAKFFNRTIQVTASLFSFAERLNRLVTFIAAARLAKKPGVKANAMKVYGKNALARQTMLRNWSAESLANFMIDETQFRMGKANRPVIMRGVGAAIMQFKGFVMQSLEAWFRLATQNGKEGVKAVAMSLGFMVLMGGLWGLPGADDLRDLIEKAYKQVTKQDLDLKTELRRSMYELTGQRWIAEVASKGATYPFGLDLSRVGMGGIAPDSPLQVFGIPADLIIGRGSRAFGKANEGDYYGAVAEFLPNFLKNPVTAYGWTQNGVRDGAGRLILDESEVGSGEVGMKSLGFQPSRITDIREYTYAQRRMETANDELKRDYASRLAKAIAKAEKYPDKAEEAMEEYDALLQELEDHNARFADRPEYQINITRQTLNQRIKREMGGAKQAWGRERKQARGAAADLREVFGLTEDVE